MWIDLQRITLAHENYIAAIGRALAIAQHLEDVSKFVLNCFRLAEGHKKGRLKTMDDLEELYQEIRRLMLGGVVRAFEQIGEISSKQIEVLKIGRDARNFVAHESALVISESPDRPDELAEKVKLFQHNVIGLIAADNLVSSWSFSIQEKENPPPTFLKSYPSKTYSWIVEPLS